MSTNFTPSYNDRIKVCDAPEYARKFNGATGTIVSPGHSRSGVRLDSVLNPGSKYGLFWFANTGLVPSDTKPIEMPDARIYISAANTAQNKNAMPVTLRCYTTKIQPGNLIAACDNHGEIFAARVVNIHGMELPENCDENRIGEVIGHVDDADYLCRQQRKNRINAIRDEMLDIYHGMSETELYETLARSNDRARELLGEYQKLTAN